MIDNAQLMPEWNWDKNTASGFDPHKLTVGSERKVWWKCSKGHEWEAVCYSRIAGNQCPICSGRQVLIGYNDLYTLMPEVALQWHPTKNSEFTSKDVTINSHRKVWWLGACGHEWEAPISERTRGRGCPICKSKKVVAGINDLATTHPFLAKQWHPSKNEKKPTQVLPQSNKSVWWVCEKGHEWEALVYSRKHRGCPYCSGNMVLIGYNDLSTTHPDLAAQWHPTKNNKLTAFDVSAGSNRMVWWLGECGHEWKAVIGSRASGCGCPTCSEERKTSFPENAVFFYLKSVYPDTVKSYRVDWLGHMELDIYIPSLQVAVEYDGQAWHNNIENDTRKGLLCKEHAIRLIRIREPRCPELECEYIKLNSTSTIELEQAVRTLFKDFLLTSNNVDIDIERDRTQIYDVISYSKKSNSLLMLSPNLATEWHPILNGTLKPENISYKSNKKVWWKCTICGHEWQATVNHRSNGRGCPECAKQKRKKN